MLTETFKVDYQSILSENQYSLIRHPVRSTRARLGDLLDEADSNQQAEVYGQGELVNEFEKEIAQLLGHDAGLFLPSGTMAQVMALKIWSEEKQNTNIAFHPTSHLELHEQHAYRELYRLKGVLVGQHDQVIKLSDLQNLSTEISALLVELPMREIGGQLPGWDELEAQSKWAKEKGVAFHLDGARLWSCESYYQKSLKKIASLFDSVYVSFYKDLDGISGAMLLGNESFIEKARIWLRRTGGNLITMFPEILAAKVGIKKHLPKMQDYVKKAQTIARYFEQCDNIKLIPVNPPCNLFHLVINQQDEELMPKVLEWSKHQRVTLLPLPRTCTLSTSRFEITVGENALKLQDEQWQKLIKSFSQAIR
ncbi:MAG: beta-eliminating lyase-related protein [Gammaproteobacteria bacterium]|nr:beta-eliminating lyase-related protein [Gammaproteobacteria bacterium]MDH5630368.1 beta-eliminating lyase-related protein [Gammaproteobacteria bacterium]